jgi:hypothetical protein
VDNALRVQKDIVSPEPIAPRRPMAFRTGFVRIVDIADSPPQFTDKGIAGRYIPAGDKDTHESTYSG